MILWRISNYPDLSGLGGLKAAARWHNRGAPIVYLAENPALAMLEVLVNMDLTPDEVPDNYQLLEVQYLPNKGVSQLHNEALTQHWQDDIELTRAIGDEWLVSTSSVLMRVPSVVVPKSYNYLFNPKHPLSKDNTVISVTRHPFDRRLMV